MTLSWEEFVKYRDVYCQQRERGNVDTEVLSKLSPYKVKNAIIMAAGMSTRFAPFSNWKPKALAEVRGEIMIERQIRQLQETGDGTVNMDTADYRIFRRGHAHALIDTPELQAYFAAIIHDYTKSFDNQGLQVV